VKINISPVLLSGEHGIKHGRALKIWAYVIIILW